MSEHSRQLVVSSRWLAIIAVLAVLAIGGCTPGSGDPSNTGIAPSARPATGEWGPCPADFFVKDPDKSFDRSQVDCTTIEVPAVYGKDQGLPDFGLALMRVRH